MEKEIIIHDDKKIAIIKQQETIIHNVDSAFDIIIRIAYEDGCDCIAINQTCFHRDFFDLSTGMAGEILQKFVTYHKRIAIIGDFSNYTSKALHDFIYECNHGNHIFFVPNQEEAILRLSAATT